VNPLKNEQNSMITNLKNPRPELHSTSYAQRYQDVRSFTEALAQPLSPEDCAIQSMPDASPTRWHLAHTTWFFETFILSKLSQYQPFDPQFAYLFNSYYNTLGKQFPRAQRGLLSRPSLDEIYTYRAFVDRHMLHLLNQNGSIDSSLAKVLEVGINHEQQHQELILTDIKHLLSCNPSCPIYRRDRWDEAKGTDELHWIAIDGGLRTMGHQESGFSYDNEGPQHRIFLESYSLCERLVSCGDYLRFIEDGGYTRPNLWLSLGWDFVCRDKWQAPLYWRSIDGQWHEFTLAGLKRIDVHRPVCHISYLEADAFARWAGYRLPTEFEWEHAAQSGGRGQFADTLIASGTALHPNSQDMQGNGDHTKIQQMFGDVWEWTSSPYVAYPGYLPPQGALGEYNGKFMCNQYVLRGGSCATPSSHIRATYRNFFPPEARWQFTGIRLAR
jgi:ergothioneine biosynthesis protein EgtB